MSHLCEKSLCTACGACLNACPFDAISWRTDRFGEEYPFIDPDKCRDCGACTRACPQLGEPFVRRPLQSYGCWMPDIGDRAKCSSGGCGKALSLAVLDRGGTVFGCTFRDGKNHHVAVHTAAELEALSGSKYVWSDVEHTFREVRELLRQPGDAPVLFIGTPCQTDGLKHMLGELAESPRFFCADLICHGTPPPAYIREFLQKTEGGEPERLVCRDQNGVALHGRLKDGREFHHSGGFGSSAYLLAYIHGIPYRERCYSCRYAAPERAGDVTLGDYWGISRAPLSPNAPELVSIAYLNTPKGESLFEMAGSRLAHYPVPVGDAVGGKRNMQCPQTRPDARDVFLKALPDAGFTAAVQRALRWERSPAARLFHLRKALARRLRRLLRR